MPNPLVSVILRTCDRPAFLREALEGLAAQTFRDFETVVVNDGHEDVRDIAREFEVSAGARYIHLRPKRGRCGAGNCGIEEARGKYIAYLDDDDLYYPEHLGTLVEALEGGDHQVAYTDAYEARQRPLPDGRGYEVYQRRLLLSYDFHPVRLFMDCFLHLVTMMHRKRCVELLGGFDEKLEVLEDWDLFFRLSQDYTFLHVPKVTAEYRIRDDGTQAITTMRDAFLATREQLFQKYFHTMVPALVRQYFEQAETIQALRGQIDGLRAAITRLESGKRNGGD